MRRHRRRHARLGGTGQSRGNEASVFGDGNGCAGVGNQPANWTDLWPFKESDDDEFHEDLCPDRHGQRDRIVGTSRRRHDGRSVRTGPIRTGPNSAAGNGLALVPRSESRRPILRLAGRFGDRRATDRRRTPLDTTNGAAGLLLGGITPDSFFTNAHEALLWRNDQVNSIEVNFTYNPWGYDNRGWNATWLVGLRYFKFDENLLWTSVAGGFNYGDNGGAD